MANTPIQEHAILNANITATWFLSKQDVENKFYTIRSNGNFDDDLYYSAQSRQALVFPLINGERSFSALYDAIIAAKSSIEMICWGFQPSFYLKRTGNTMPLGELLKYKAEKDNVQVKILCYSAPLGFQNFLSEDLMNMPNYPYSFFPEAISTRIWKSGDLRHINIDWWENHQNIKNLTFQTHGVRMFHGSEYIDKKTTTGQKLIYAVGPSNHQKTVLIDFDGFIQEKDIIPSGFVLGHNYLDDYWDNDKHLYDNYITESNVYNAELACKGRNTSKPLQDVSCKVYGAPLALLKKNFDELWTRAGKNKIPENAPAIIDGQLLTNLAESIQTIPQNLSVGNENITGFKLHAQILRTYREKKVKDIARLYIQNIRKACQFIYTENQYFRWPVLVEALKEFLEQSKKMTNIPEDKTIYWFVLTNSSDTGIGLGTRNTDRLFASLGKRHQMPEVARNLDWQPEFDDDEQKQEEMAQLSVEQKKWEKRDKTKSWMTPAQLQEHERIRRDLDKRYYELYKDYDSIDSVSKELKKLGLKSIICTLIAEPKDGNWQYPWHETYIHSKCTIINDVMTILGSANINTRSMEVDTEIAIVTESEEYATDLRKKLWQIHAKSDEYPFAAYQDTNMPLEEIFQDWELMAKRNLEREINGEQPSGRIKLFFRPNSKVSYLD